MDCGGTSSHEYDCNIGTAPEGNINRLAFSELYKLTMMHDPEQWREHEGPPSPTNVESAEDQIKGMLGFLKSEKSFKDDPDIQGLPDDQKIIVWGLKQTGATIVYPNGEVSDTMFDHEWEDDNSTIKTTNDEKEPSETLCNEIDWDQLYKKQLASVTPEDWAKVVLVQGEEPGFCETCAEDSKEEERENY